jgi:hypothetical protein
MRPFDLEGMICAQNKGVDFICYSSLFPNWWHDLSRVNQPLSLEFEHPLLLYCLSKFIVNKIKQDLQFTLQDTTCTSVASH